MRHLIIASNRRVHFALRFVRTFGRNQHTVNEVNAALRQRRDMRQKFRFAVWLKGHQRELRYRFDAYLGQQALRIITRDGERETFRQFCLTYFQNN